MDWMKVMAGGAVLGVIASCWDKVKAILWRIASLLVQRIELNTEYVHNAVIGHLIANYPRSITYDKIFGAWNEQQRDGRYALVSYEQFGIRNLVFWQGWRPFLFRNAQEAKAGKPIDNENLHAGTKIYSTITYRRAATPSKSSRTAATGCPGSSSPLTGCWRIRPTSWARPRCTRARRSST
jgi:hypothetical protein